VEFLTTLDRDRIAALLERDEYFWLDLESPGAEDVQQLGGLLGLHELAIEDSINFDQRPKLEEYGNHVFVVFYGVAPPKNGVPGLVETHIYVSGSWVVTIHHSHCEELARVREALRGGSPDESEQFVVYRVFDALTDSFFGALEPIEHQLEHLEEVVVGTPAPGDREKLLELGHYLSDMRRRVSAQRDILAREMEQITQLPGLEPGTRDYFRDVYDHLVRIYEEIESNRERLAAAMQLYVSSVSNRLNEVMERLTVIATIFLPLTVITGFFGQNFGWLVRNINTQADFLIFGVGGMVVPIVLMLTVFKARGWI
jgi:magnesium transporter